MATPTLASLPPVARTLLIPLAYRARENRRPDAIVRDPKAEELLCLFDDRLPLGWQDLDQVCTLLRLRQFDRYSLAFLDQHPTGCLVDIGCGLDTRFFRVDNGRMEWFGLDLPEVIEVRQKLLPAGPRSHLIGCSVLDFAWLDRLPNDGRPALFLAEGVFPYLEESDVRRLLLAIRERYPGAEIAFDVINTFSVRVHNAAHRGLHKAQVRLRWAVEDLHVIESWGEGIRLIEEWRYFSQHEKRLGVYNLMRYVPAFDKANRVLRVRLGEGKP